MPLAERDCLGGTRLSWRNKIVLAKRVGAERGCLGGTRLSWRNCFGFKSNEGVSEGVSEGVN